MSIHVFFIFATIVYPMCHLKWMHSAKSIQKGKRRKQFFYTWYRYDDRQWPMVHQFTFGIRYPISCIHDDRFHKAILSISSIWHWNGSWILWSQWMKFKMYASLTFYRPSLWWSLNGCGYEYDTHGKHQIYYGSMNSGHISIH